MSLEHNEHNLSPAEQAFFDDARKYLLQHPEFLMEASTQGIFSLLLQRGLEARSNGNYGIAACVAVRSEGLEIIVFGQNTLVSEGNPHGHAEMNAIKNARSLIQSPELLTEFIRNGTALVRASTVSTPESALYTTLEPCPMCTVGAAINGGINKVVIGTEDTLAGGLSPDRLANLAPLWKQIADDQGLETFFCQDEDPQGENYIPAELRTHLNNLFFQTREKLDEHLRKHGFLDLLQLIAVAHLHQENG